MPRILKCSNRPLDNFPWCEWINVHVWEDDEFENTLRRENLTIAEKSSSLHVEYTQDLSGLYVK